MSFSEASLLWQLFLIFASLFVAVILWLTYKIVFRPLIKIYHYKKQGVNCQYFPLIGRFCTFEKSFRVYGDCEYEWKNASKRTPMRALCSNFGSDADLILLDPALVKDFCLNVDNYIKDPVFLEIYAPVMGKGLITSEGDQWKTQRKVLSSIFHFEFLKSNIPIIQDTIRRTLGNLRTSMNDINIMNFFQSMTGEVIGKIFFREQLNQFQLDGKPLTLALADLLAEIGILSVALERFILGTWFIRQGFLPKHRKLMKKAQAYRKICRQIIEERKIFYSSQNPQERKKGMVELLLESSVAEEEIIDQFSSFFLAGMDTTAHLVLIAVYQLHTYPQIKEKIIEEIKQHYKPGEEVTIENLNKLEYMMAFFKETLRTMTPIPGTLPRRAIRDHMIGDILVKKGDLVDLEFFYNNYNHNYFTEAEKFDPDRWLEKDKNLDPYAFTPFSAGPRNCVGQHLALIEARIILAEFLTMYDFKLKEGYELKMSFTFLYEPVNPILLSLTPKKL